MHVAFATLGCRAKRLRVLRNKAFRISYLPYENGVAQLLNTM
jgi:hypothetical protein